MDSRRALTAGGATAIAVSVVVTGVLAVSHAVALTDVAGEPVSAAPVVVPSPSARVVAPTPTISHTPSHEVQVVPAPAPRDVSEPPARKPAPATPAPRATVAPQPQKSTDPRDFADVIAQFEKDGDWRKVMSWLATHDGNRKAWREYLRDHGRDHDRRGTRSSFGASQTPATAGHESGRYLPSNWAGSKKERSRVSPDQRD